LKIKILYDLLDQKFDIIDKDAFNYGF